MSGYTVTHCWCISTSVDPSFSLCFSEGFYYCLAINCVTDCTCICTSLSLSLWASGYIIGNLHVYEQARSVRSACNCAIYIFFFSSFCVDTFSLFVFVSWFIFLSLCLWMCVAVSGYIIPHCMCKCTSLDACFSLTFSLNVFIVFRIYCH